MMFVVCVLVFGLIQYVYDKEDNMGPWLAIIGIVVVIIIGMMLVK